MIVIKTLRQQRFLFLDRDGVLNRRPKGYVRSWAEWIWLPGAKEALVALRPHFERIVVVTNQQGVGKGLMSPEGLRRIHARMQREVALAGGRIDGVYACTDRATQAHNCRKPGPALAYRARADFPEIDFGASVMVGDTASDMQFGRGLGMYCVWLETERERGLVRNFDAKIGSLRNLIE